MNNEEWNKSNNALEMLYSLKNISEESFIQKTKKLQRFYISCCRKKLFLLSDVEFVKGLDIVEAYIKHHATEKDVSKQSWKTEGAVFNLEYNSYFNFGYNSYSANASNTFKKVKIHTGLSHEKAKEYAIDLGYFIDWTMSYTTDFSGEIPKEHKFLLPNLLRNEIKSPFS